MSLKYHIIHYIVKDIEKQLEKDKKQVSSKYYKIALRIYSARSLILSITLVPTKNLGQPLGQGSRKPQNA